MANKALVFNLDLHLCVNASIADSTLSATCYNDIYNSVSYNMSLFELTIGWLAPPHCVGCRAEGIVLCEACLTSGIIPFGERCWRCGALSERCFTCLRCRRNGSPRAVWISVDYEGLPQELIKAYKFNQLRAAVGPIARVMAETLKAFNTDEDIAKKDYLIVPVPTASTRMRQRGFDHAKLLAHKLSAELKLENLNVLMRSSQTRQVGSVRSLRQAQADGNYSVKASTHIKKRNILLIDDVVTTGATLAACAKTLRLAGAKNVDALVFAKRL
jgi:ComF family protein